MMLSVTDSIHGWSPIGSSDEDVHISQDMYFMTIKSTCTPLTGVTQSTVAPSSDRRAQRNRNRNPSWIPRPRNAFIIFRCEYSREHSQGASSQDPQDDQDSTNPTAKTLSKRAAEAWKELPTSERERYKMLADKEREEHARLYPHYRFRPMKRQMSGGTKTAPQEHSKAPRIPSVERPSSATSTHLPSVLAPAPEKARSSRSESLELEAYELSAIDHRTELPLAVDLPGPYASPDSETTVFSNLSSPSPPLSAELHTPPCASAVNIPPDTSLWSDSTSGIHEDGQALDSYMVGLYNYDLFSPFLFPEYY